MEGATSSSPCSVAESGPDAMGRGPGTPKFIPGASQHGARGRSFSALCSVVGDGVKGIKQPFPFTWPAMF